MLVIASSYSVVDDPVKTTSTPGLWVAPIAPYSGGTVGSLVGPADAASLGVPLTNLDEPLFDGAGATKRDLINYLDSVADRIIPELADRAAVGDPCAPGQEAFMQKNLPSYTPPWVRG